MHLYYSARASVTVVGTLLCLGAVSAGIARPTTDIAMARHLLSQRKQYHQESTIQQLLQHLASGECITLVDHRRDMNNS